MQDVVMCENVFPRILDCFTCRECDYGARGWQMKGQGVWQASKSSKTCEAQ